MQPRVLLDGLAMPESPRWHDGRLWFSNWGTRQIVAVDLDGNSEVVGEGPDGLGWATNWLPDGRLLITGPELIPDRARRVARPARGSQPHLADRLERDHGRRARQHLRQHGQLRLRRGERTALPERHGGHAGQQDARRRRVLRRTAHRLRRRRRRRERDDLLGEGRHCCIGRSLVILTVRSSVSGSRESGLRASAGAPGGCEVAREGRWTWAAPEDLLSRSPAVAQCNSALPSRCRTWKCQNHAAPGMSMRCSIALSSARSYAGSRRARRARRYGSGAGTGYPLREAAGRGDSALWRSRTRWSWSPVRPRASGRPPPGRRRPVAPGWCWPLGGSSGWR